jgi:hypothetical protein
VKKTHQNKNLKSGSDSIRNEKALALQDRPGACYAHPMPALILPLIEAVAYWPERGALVGLDLGTKTIGVAVSDPSRRLATGVETIQRKAFKADAARLLAIA